MQRITRLFVERPPLVFVLLSLIAIAGLWASATIIVQEFPNVDFPTISVSASYPGGAPSELRDAIVRPIEDAIAGAPGLQSLTSSIQQNQATISASFDLATNKTTDLTEVGQRLQSIKAALPQDLSAPSVRSFDPSQATVVTLAVSSRSLNYSDLSAIVTNSIVPTLEQVSGVSNVNANGVVTPALEVYIDPLRLTAFGSTPTDVVSAIQGNNARIPGGILSTGKSEVALDVRGDVQTPQSILDTPLAINTSVLHGSTSPSGTTTVRYSQSSGTTNQALALSNAAQTSGVAADTVDPFQAVPQRLRIADVASVVDGFEAKRVFSYLNGHQSISLGIQKESNASEVTTSQAVIEALPHIESLYPQIHFDIVNVQGDETRAQLEGVLQTLLEGIVFTGIVMLIFLRSWRNAVVVLIAIPTSLFIALFVMRIIGFTVDSVSLLAMTLIIGILVDDSIVVLENCERHYEQGALPREAAIQGRAEIGTAAVVITLVDVVVFLPIAFLPGQVGRYLSEFGLVVTIATLTSLAISFTITPSLVGNWSLISRWKPWSIIENIARGFERLRSWYILRLLPLALRHSLIVASVCTVLTVGAVMLIPLGAVGFEFIPAVDRGQISVQVQYPTGTPLSTTNDAVVRITNRLMDMPAVLSLTSIAGGSQSGFGGNINLGSSGQIRVFLKPSHRGTTDAIAQEMTRLSSGLAPHAHVVAIPATGTRGGNAQPVDITVATTRGEPEAYAAEITDVLRSTPGAANVNSSSVNTAPQLDIRFDRERARALNADIGLASQAIRAAFGGTTATQFDTTNGTKVVQVLYPFSAETSLQTLLDLPLRTRSGTLIHLSDIAAVVNNPIEPLINRSNRQTVIHIGANLAPGASQTGVQRAFEQRLQALHLPSTVIVGAGSSGSQQNLTQTIGGISISLELSLLLVYLLMIALYNAYRAPLVIMFSIPVAACGAFGALALTGQSLNLYSMIGVIMLVGLVSKNGILLVDFAVLKVEAGMDKRSAIIEAARDRFRPIIMTTLSMIAGMLPLALALDPGSAAKRSLGTVVIGGLTSSLFLTLILVPVVFLWIAPRPLEAAT